MGAGASHALGSEQNPALETGGSFKLEPTEHVDAPGHATQSGGECSQQACLRGTELDQAGFTAPEEPPKPEERKKISKRRDAALHGNDGALYACLGSGVVYKFARTGDEQNAEACAAKSFQAWSPCAAGFLAGYTDDDGRRRDDTRREMEGVGSGICHDRPR